jgi:hypothetical protein
VARVQILTDDLLFGSRLEADLTGAGHTVSHGLVPEGGADAIVADLTHDGPARIAALAAAQRPPVLAFYSHVEVDVRERARAAGFEMVVPRSRIVREGPALLAALLVTGR